MIMMYRKIPLHTSKIHYWAKNTIHLLYRICLINSEQRYKVVNEVLEKIKIIQSDSNTF